MGSLLETPETGSAWDELSYSGAVWAWGRLEGSGVQASWSPCDRSLGSCLMSVLFSPHQSVCGAETCESRASRGLTHRSVRPFPLPRFRGRPAMSGRRAAGPSAKHPGQVPDLRTLVALISGMVFCPRLSCVGLEARDSGPPPTPGQPPSSGHSTSSEKPPLTRTEVLPTFLQDQQACPQIFQALQA